MGLLGRANRRVFVGSLLGLVGCGSCEVGSQGPVPGGFDPAAMIPRAGQVRLTERGLLPIAQVLLGELQRGSTLSCNVDADCPTFVDGAGAPIASHCELGRQRCVDTANNTPTPGVLIALPPETSGLSLCRGGGACELMARIDGLTVTPRAGQGAGLEVQAQLAPSSFSVADFGQGLDCRLSIAAGALNVGFGLDVGPRNTPGTLPQLVVDVSSAQVQLANGLLSLSADPVYGDAGDQALCTAANLTPLQTGLIARLEGQLLPLAQGLLGQALGKVCDTAADCGLGATCTAEGWCQANVGTTIVPETLNFEERLVLPSLLGSVGYSGRSGAPADGALLIGGTFDADAQGLGFGVLAGLEPVELDAVCAQQRPSPRLRPTFVAPSPLPATSSADLDFDGTPETPYGIAFGVSKALVDQLVHGIYASGLICGAITTADIDVHTGTLEILIPSLRFLTKSHLFPRSERPVRLSVFLAEEPEVALDSGRTVDNGSGPEYLNPVLRLDLKRLQLNLQVLVDERWVRVLTVELDLHLGLGVMVTPANELVPLVGVGVTQLLENVVVRNSELLLESPASLESAIPTLVSFAFLEFSGAQDPIPLPAINGVDYQVLGVRGLATGGRYDQLAIYADLLQIQTGNLSAAVKTDARLVQVVVPDTSAFAVDHPGGPTLPAVQLAFVERSPDGRTLEHQYALDGGGWSGFFRGPNLVLSRPELLLQGRHELLVRSRAVGDYRSLDPAPVTVPFYVDSEDPILSVKEVQAGLQIEAFDRVSRDQLRIELLAGTTWRALAPDAQGLVPLSDEERVAAPLLVQATDQAGRVSEVILRGAQAPADGSVNTGCRATGVGEGGLWALGLLFGLYGLRRRR
jgi:uncharacterized protein (TIGR03382 family)